MNINSLFLDDSRSECIDTNPNPKEELTGPMITKEEVAKVISIAKNNKARGPDGIPAEILKLIDDNNLNISVIFDLVRHSLSYFGLYFACYHAATSGCIGVLVVT